MRSDTEKLSFWNLLLKACGEILKASANSLCVVPVSASKALTFVPIKSASLLELNQMKLRIKETAKWIKAFIIFVRPRKWSFRLPFLHGLHSQPRTWRRTAEWRKRQASGASNCRRPRRRASLRCPAPGRSARLYAPLRRTKGRGREIRPPASEWSQGRVYSSWPPPFSSHRLPLSQSMQGSTLSKSKSNLHVPQRNPV